MPRTVRWRPGGTGGGRLRGFGSQLWSIARIWLGRLGRITPRRLWRNGRRLVRRRAKALRRRLTRHPRRARAPVFIHGSNRSGSQMVCRALGDSRHGWEYWEGSTVAFDRFYLRPDRFIEWLVKLAPAPIVSFGCILDSQRSDRLLARFDGARAIWVYRRYEDAASSSVRRWGEHQKELALAVAAGELDRLGPRGERIELATIELFRELCDERMSLEAGGCLYWYLRNSIYFDLELDRDPRVLLLQYEDAVLDPQAVFRRVFEFLDYPYHDEIVGQIFSSSVGRHPWPGVAPPIERLCDELQRRLDTHYVATGGRNRSSLEPEPQGS